MSVQDVLNQFDKNLKGSGFDRKTNNKFGWRVVVFISISTFLLIDNVFQAVIGFADFATRVEGLRNTIFYGLFIMYAFSYIICWEDLMLAVGVIEKGNHGFPYHDRLKSGERISTKNQIMATLSKIGHCANILILIYACVSSVVPLIFLMRTYFTAANLTSIQADNLPLPYKFYFPEPCKQIHFYLSVYSVQLWWSVFAVRYHFIAAVLPVSLILFLANGMKVLRLSLDEIDRILKPPTRSGYSHAEMKKYIQYVAGFHQRIIRDVRIVNKGYQSILFFYNFMIGFIVCVPLYMLTQKEGFRTKTSEVMLIVVGLMTSYMFNYSAESINTQEENLRMTLLHCNWVDKPKWFKTCLLIIMTRNNRFVEIKPFGLFVLGLNNFSLTVNAAYSYFNLLRTI